MADAIFSPLALQAQVDRLMKDVPQGRKVAVVGIATSDGKWRVTAKARLGDDGHWQLEGSVSGHGGHDLVGEVSVLASW